MKILEGVGNIISCILGFIGGIAGGWLAVWYRECLEVRRKHFKEIKEKVLNPILNGLTGLANRFHYNKDTPFETMFEMLDRKIRWFDIFSIENESEDKLLYADLQKHFPKLLQRYNVINDLIKSKYPWYLELLRRTYNAVSQALRVRSLELDILKDEKNFQKCLKVSIFKLLGIDKYSYPNLYEEIKTLKLGQLSEEVVKEISSKPFVKELLELRARILDFLNETINETQHVINLPDVDLPGECPYTLSMKRLIKRWIHV